MKLRPISMLAACLLLWAGVAAQARTYAEAQEELAWLSHDAAMFRNSMKAAIKAQTDNLEVVNRLRQAKISVDEMIQRDNISKACKVVDVAFTVGTLGVGGIGVATAEGLSVLSKEGAKIAGKYILEKGAVEGGKEAAGVPGYSDSVKVGAYIFNKVSENEVKGQLSKDNIDVLLKARQLLEDDSDGRTLNDKRPELRDMISEAEGKLEKTATDIKALDKLIEDLQKKGAVLSAEAAKLKEEERKNSEKEAEKAKKAEPSGLANTEISRPAEVPPALIGPKDTPEEKRRKVQESLDKYISSLGARIDAEKKAANTAWSALKKPEGDTRYARFDGTDQIKDLLYTLAYYEGKFTEARTYSNMQDIETSARNDADSIAKNRQQLENYKNDVKAGIEPIILNLSGYLAQWRSVYNTYKPQGYYVGLPEDIKATTPWIAYYEGPLKRVASYIEGTEGLESKFRDVSAKAAGQKDSIYSDAKSLADAYSGKVQDFKNYKPQAAAQLQGIVDKLSKAAAPVYALPNDFQNEFAYNGKSDLAELGPKISAAKAAFSEMQSLGRAGSLLYSDLQGKYSALDEMSRDPLMNEASTIRYIAENKAHKEAMDAVLKKTAEYQPDMSGAESSGYLESAVTGGADMIFGAEDALRYLQAAEKRMLDAVGSAQTALKANLSEDLSYLEKADPAKYAEATGKIFKPAYDVDENLRGVQEEVRSTFFFDPAEELKPQKLKIVSSRWGPMVDGKTPLLFSTGFYPKSVGQKKAELDKITSDFWESPQGKRITEARRLTELQVSRDNQDPGLPVVRKMYEDFKNAYESRSSARVMSFISPEWTAGDGTAASDLDEQFNRIFRMFDEIKVEITGLQVVGDGNGMYTASYKMAIRSRIYKKNIKREEDSSVYEHVEVNGASAKIKKTEAGGYWNVK